MLRVENGTVHIVTADDSRLDRIYPRRYAICVTPVQGSDRGWCGALVDVTSWPVIRVTDDCGIPANHRAPTTGPDALSPTGW